MKIFFQSSNPSFNQSLNQSIKLYLFFRFIFHHLPEPLSFPPSSAINEFIYNADINWRNSFKVKLVLINFHLFKVIFLLWVSLIILFLNSVMVIKSLLTVQLINILIYWLSERFLIYMAWFLNLICDCFRNC